jgi:formylglycine-generating enzyme required for sulfatase activity
MAKIKNTLLAPIGDYPLLVTVKDKEKDPNLGEVSAYQVGTAHVTLTGVWLRELVHIPAGDFTMGSDPAVDPQALTQEEPQHVHPTGEYYIGRYELTNEEYAQFMADGGYDDPEWWSSDGWSMRVKYGWAMPGTWNEWPKKITWIGIGFPDYPVSEISWYEAEAFCNWAGGRLPSEAEWEKAARGTDGRIFPWGNDWDVNKCQCDKNGVGPTPVGEHSPEGDSPYGVADTIGNVEEWVQDWLDLYIYIQYAGGDFTPPGKSFPYTDFRSVRGSDFAHTYNNGDCRTSWRTGDPDYIQVLSNGFRVVFNP